MIDVASQAEMNSYLETHFPRVNTKRRGSVVHDRALVEAL